MSKKSTNSVDILCHSVGGNYLSKLTIDKIYRNDTYKLIYVHSGSLLVLTDGKSYTVNEDCTFAVFPDIDFSIIENNNCRYYWVEFSGFEGAAIMSRIAFSRDNPLVGEIKIEGIEMLFEFPPGNENADYAKYRVGGLIIYLLSFYMERFPAENNLQNHYVREACDYIEQSYAECGFGVQEVARYLKIDRTYLYRLFKNETGISIIDYILRRRIAHAEVLMLNPRLTVKDISYACGFSDQMYFSRMFKKLNGKTPTQFRETITLREQG